MTVKRSWHFSPEIQFQFWAALMSPGTLINIALFPKHIPPALKPNVSIFLAIVEAINLILHHVLLLLDLLGLVLIVLRLVKHRICILLEFALEASN